MDDIGKATLVSDDIKTAIVQVGGGGQCCAVMESSSLVNIQPNKFSS